MAAFQTTLPVRFGDIDHARLMYYPKFYHYFHQAFEEIYPQRLQMHYQQVLDVDKIGFPAVHQKADFISPVRYGEAVLVTITCQKIGQKSVTIDYQMQNEATKELRCSCQMVLVCLDMEMYQSILIPPKYRALFEDLRE